MAADYRAVAIRLSKAGFAALDAQRRYDYWTQFKTNSVRAQRAEERLDAAVRELEAADEQLAELLKETP